MTDEPASETSEEHPEASDEERGRQEAGQREQGVRSEHSSDRSSPQLTTPAKDRRGTPESGAQKG